MFIGLVAVGYLIQTGFLDTTNTKTTLTNISTDESNNESVSRTLAIENLKDEITKIRNEYKIKES